MLCLQSSAKSQRGNHCERSEATQGPHHAAPGLLLRFAPRNDEPSPSIHHPLPTLPVGLPQLPPQNLAGDVARDRVDEIDGPGDFVVRDPLARQAMMLAGSRGAPGRATTIALTVSPHFSSGMPIT